MCLRISWYLCAFKLQSKVNICPLKSVRTPNCSPVKTLVRMTSTQTNFPETICAEILRFCKSAAGPKRSRRWRSQRWRSWAAVVKRLRLWGRLDILPNSLKCRRRRIMLEKLTLNSLATALNIPAVSITIACSLKLRHLVLWCYKTAHFRVAFYCPQQKMNLCNDHCLISYLICHTCQVAGLTWQRRNAH
jgi:hypothetical protein